MWGCRCLFELASLFSLGKYPDVELLDHRVVLLLIYEAPPQCSPQWLHQFTFSPTAHKGSLCPHPHPRFPLIFLPITIVMTVRRYRIVVLSLMISDIEHLYVGLLVICVSCLEKCLFRSSAYFFNQDFLLLLSCMTSLYILDINLLSNT